jgi:hypothetical protein
MWTDTTTGERVGSIRYEAHLGHESVRVRLNYTKTGWDGERCESDCWIQLETTSQPLRRPTMVVYMPTGSVRAAELYLPNGAFTFASRQSYRLPYACQREPVHYRALRRASSSGASLGRRAESGDYMAKPKWMRWSTYDRKLEEIFAAEEIVDAHTLILDRKLDRCLGR